MIRGKTPKNAPKTDEQKDRKALYYKDFCGLSLLAEKERFELSRRYSRPTPLAGAPLRPLEYFSVYSLAGCRFLLPADITYYTQFFSLCQYLFAILSVAFCGFFAFLFFGDTNGGGKTRSCDARRAGSDSW